MTIYKYPVPAQHGQHDIALPVGAQLLTLQFQGSDLMLWAVVPSPYVEAGVTGPQSPLPMVGNHQFVNQSLFIAYTGMSLPPLRRRRYIATAQSESGLVVHGFELLPRQDGMDVVD